MAQIRQEADCGFGKDRAFTSSFDVWSKISKQDGMMALYRGFGLGVLGVFVYRALYFGLFDTVRAELFPDPEAAKVSSLSMLASIVTMTADFASYPIDTVRKTMMVDTGRSERHYMSATDCCSKIFAKEGMRGFYRGYTYKLLFMFGQAFPLVGSAKLF